MLKMQDGRPLIVPEPVMRPNQCALNPHITRDAEGFIDTGVKLAGFAPRVYVAISSLRDVTRSLGWPSPEERDGLQARIAELEAELETSRALVAERDGALDAVAVLRNAGYSAARKPGRPAKAVA